ncbi:hypothetical protein DSO57_1030291 [Entomophthora muscae]|uniref:Uncharacterized protein n=1 Tax=Entomophthora muscae TaxID=34485 RepID=A0ACC2TYW3_9FUNG|nr:hypothetical protein DSO57_1030291 [Entomophthora muscae]
MFVSRAMSNLVRNRIRRMFTLVVVTLVWASAIVPQLVMHTVFNEKYMESDIVASQMESKPGIIIWAFFRGFNPATADVTLDIGVTLFQTGTEEMKVTIGRNSFNISATDARRINIPAYPVDNKDMTVYPMDEYEESCTITASYASGHPANIAFGLIGNDQTYRLHHKLTKPSSDEIKITYRLERHGSTKVMCLLVFLINWLLALAMINLTVDNLLYSRDTPPSIILAGFTIVFSLPALRKSQPGIPEVGSILDLAGFFW